MTDPKLRKAAITPKAQDETPTPSDAPTDYPPVGAVVSTGTSWDTSIDPGTIPRLNAANIFTIGQTFNATVQFTGAWVVFSPAQGTAFMTTTQIGGNADAEATVIQPGGALASPAITVAGSPVVTVAMLDPVQVEARLAALEAGGVTPPPGDDPRAQTRAALETTAQANQDLNDEIFAQQRDEAQRVEDIFNPPTRTGSRRLTGKKSGR